MYVVVTGHVITVDSALLKEQQQAVLVSPVLDQQDWSCVRLVYQITGGGSLQLFLRPDGDNFDYRMWTANQASDSWLIASVDLPNSTTPYQVSCSLSSPHLLSAPVFNSIFVPLILKILQSSAPPAISCHRHSYQHSISHRSLHLKCV